MKYAFLLVMILITVSFAVHGIFDWQSFSGQPGDVCTVNLLESDANHIVVDVTVPGFWLGNTVTGGITWDSIELPEFYSQMAVGLPEVPNVPQMFALPFGTEAVVTFEDVEYTTYSGINLVPVQIPEIDMPHNPYPFRQDEAAYCTNGFLPSVWAETVSPGIWGGISIDRLLVNPFRYNPVTCELMAARFMRVRIDFLGSSEAVAFSSTDYVRSSASRMLINYDMVDAAASTPTDADAAVYVFVTTTANLSSIMPLVEFYQSIGHESAVETFSSSASVDEIKAAITDHYDTGTTRFAMIAGDYDVLPSYNYNFSVSGYPVYGDYWYACIVGTDLTPEIAVGRLTGNASQIETQVNKIIDGYYQYSFSDANTPGIIPSTSVLAAHQESYPGKYTQCCNEIAAASYAVSMTFYKIYPPEGGTNAMVSDWFNDGVGSVGYRGHGSLTAWIWSAPGVWSKTNIQALTNAFMPPVWGIACLCGRYFEASECIAESFAWDDNGASGNLAAFSPSYTTPNHDYMKQIYLGLYNNAVYNVGETLNDAAVWIINVHGSTGQGNAKMYIWFGDPAMEIFTNDTANPTPLAIACNPETVNPGSQTITMTVTSSGSPVSGATVALSDGIDGVDGKALTFYETTTTNGSGEASFTVNVPASATILYTGARLHNYNPVAAQIDVYPTSVEDTEGGMETVTLCVGATPNPITGTAALNFSTPISGHATVQVFDITGRVVETLVSEEVGVGNHSINWTPGNIASGIYFVRLSTPAGTVFTQAMVLR
ncbi:MAG: T9SS type A sorting domain-containing protein [Candidatus Aegiribacteria sp.]|nr:T9SS type A sorting domain-containing protein [Candidatus Aegiribacteria sp.]